MKKSLIWLTISVLRSGDLTKNVFTLKNIEMETKSHYRKVFKSDHLGIADLEDFKEQGKRLVFTIKEVKQYISNGNKNTGVVVAGKRISANIAFFKEDIKPLVLNSTNSKTVKGFSPNQSPYVDDWKNITVELYIDPGVMMKGQVVGGVRIKPNQPIVQNPQLTPDLPAWKNAIEYLKKNGTIDGIKAKYSLTKENEQKLKDASI